MRMTGQETALLSEAMVDCADAWGFNPVSDPRISSSVILAGVAFAIYAPKVQAVKKHVQEKKARGHIDQPVQ